MYDVANLPRISIEMAMEDSDVEHRYYLNTQTGEVAFSSDFDDSFDEAEGSSEDFEGEEYIAVLGGDERMVCELATDYY